MHLIHSTPYLVALASAASKTTTTAKSTGSGSSAFLLVVVVLFVLLYFLLIRPNQRRRMQAVRQSRSYGVGDEVVAGGMVGRVARLGDGQVEVPPPGRHRDEQPGPPCRQLLLRRQLRSCGFGAPPACAAAGS